MNSRFNLIIFSLLLVALTTACKYFFGPVLSMSGFSPVLAIALFSGMVIRKKEWLFIFPLLSLFVSDVIIHLLYQQGLFNYAGVYSGQWKNYLLLMSCTLLGWTLRGANHRAMLIGSIASPTVFFLLSNLMVWMQSSEAFYTKTLSGLLNCYAAGLPFYKNSLIATVIFLPLVLVTFNYLARKKAALTIA